MKTALLWLATGVAWGANLKLKVVDSQDLPVPGASVILHHQTTGQDLHCRANDGGSCELDVGAQGDYLVIATANGLGGPNQDRSERSVFGGQYSAGPTGYERISDILQEIPGVWCGASRQGVGGLLFPWAFHSALGWPVTLKCRICRQSISSAMNT